MRNTAIAVVTTLVMALVAFSAMTSAALSDQMNASNRYTFAAVPIESVTGAILYRLDVETGEICAFTFARKPEGELHSCAGRESSAPGRRFSLDAVAGARGTAQSSAYRLDRMNGEVCRFRLKGTEATQLERAGCIGHVASDTP